MFVSRQFKPERVRAAISEAAPSPLVEMK